MDKRLKSKNTHAETKVVPHQKWIMIKNYHLHLLVTFKYLRLDVLCSYHNMYKIVSFITGHNFKWRSFKIKHPAILFLTWLNSSQDRQQQSSVFWSVKRFFCTCDLIIHLYLNFFIIRLSRKKSNANNICNC